MNIINWGENKIRGLSVYDFAVIKILVFTFTLLLAKLWPGILNLEWYWHGLMFAVSALWLVFNVFIPERKRLAH